MNTDWSLDISYTGRWSTVYKGPSCDACKNHARKIFRMQKHEPGIQYRIYAGNGQQLHQISGPNPTSKMKWSWGDLTPRQKEKIL
jgi:hypothetical protein